MRSTLLALLLTAICATSIGAETSQSPVTEFRRHFRLVDRDKAPYYEATVVVRTSEEKDEKYVLIRDEGHGDFILSGVWTFGDQRSISRLSDVKGRTYLQATYQYALTSKKRTDSLAEGQANPALLDVPAIFTLETNGGRWEGLHRDWDSAARLRDFRRQVRQTVDFSLLEAIERMRNTMFSTEEGSFFHAMVCKFALYELGMENDDGNGEATSAAAQEEASAPDCDFDKRFGFPCTEKQLARVRKAADEQRLLDRY